MDMNNENINTSASQAAAIRAHLEAGNTITAGEALKSFSCFRLAARINDLRNAGVPIVARRIAVISASGKSVRVAEYQIGSAE